MGFSMHRNGSAEFSVREWLPITDPVRRKIPIPVPTKAYGEIYKDLDDKGSRIAY